MLLFNVVNWVAYFYADGLLSSAQRVTYSLALVFTMAIFRYSCNRYSPLTWIFFSILTMAMVNLAFRGYLEGHDDPASLKEYEDVWLYLLFCTFLFNYNTYLTTVLCFPLPMTILYYIQL